MYGTMPLIMTYMCESRNAPLKGRLIIKTMPLIGTYMYNLDKMPLEGQLMCIKDNASN